MRKTCMLLIALALLLTTVPCLSRAEGRTISVTASATVQAEADTAIIQFGVNTSAKEVSAASAANAATIDKLIRTLTEAGIPEADIVTSNYYVGAIYDFSAGIPDENGAYPVRGYEVSNSLSVTLHDVSQAGAVSDLALANGANSCGGISFSTSKAGEAGDQALLAAIAEGNRKAALIAAACGGTLGELQSVNLVDNTGFVVVNAMRAKGEEAAMDAGTQIHADSVSFHASVEMVFLLAP